MSHYIGDGYGQEEKLQSTLPLRLGGFALRSMEEKDSAETDAAAAKKLEKKKDDKHGEASNRQGGLFMPF
eukprot:gene1964-12949_t